MPIVVWLAKDGDANAEPPQLSGAGSFPRVLHWPRPGSNTCHENVNGPAPPGMALNEALPDVHPVAFCGGVVGCRTSAAVPCGLPAESLPSIWYTRSEAGTYS